MARSERINVRLTPEERAELRRLAAKENLYESTMVRVLVLRGVAREQERENGEVRAEHSMQKT